MYKVRDNGEPTLERQKRSERAQARLSEV